MQMLEDLSILEKHELVINEGLPILVVFLRIRLCHFEQVSLRL